MISGTTALVSQAAIQPIGMEQILLVQDQWYDCISFPANNTVYWYGANTIGTLSVVRLHFPANNTVYWYGANTIGTGPMVQLHWFPRHRPRSKRAP